MGKKITEYPNTATSIEADDFLDISKKVGVSYESQKLPGSSIGTILGSTIYRASVATLAAGSNTVNFSSTLGTTSYILIIDEIDGVGVDKANIVKSKGSFAVDSLAAGDINYIAILIV